MPNFILTRSSVIVCPHGGMVTHVPASYSGELINNELPLLLNDMYFIAGCPFTAPSGPSPCMNVVWTQPSMRRLVGGIPVLTNASVGIVQSAGSVPQGAVIIASHQTVVTD